MLTEPSIEDDAINAMKKCQYTSSRTEPAPALPSPRLCRPRALDRDFGIHDGKVKTNR